MERQSRQREAGTRHWRGARRPRGAYAAALRFPLHARSEEPVVARSTAPHVGPYETSYDVSHGYCVDRQIVRP